MSDTFYRCLDLLKATYGREYGLCDLRNWKSGMALTFSPSNESANPDAPVVTVRTYAGLSHPSLTFSHEVYLLLLAEIAANKKGPDENKEKQNE
jgi:hypothetical protein